MGGADAAVFEPLIAGIGWIGGLMALGIALSVGGLAWWWAGHMERPDLARIFARVLLSSFGVACLLIGTWAFGIATEAALGLPLGRSSGGTAILAYWITLLATNRDLAMSAALLRQAEHPLLAGLFAAAGLAAWGLTKVMLFFVVVVALGSLFGA